MDLTGKRWIALLLFLLWLASLWLPAIVTDGGEGLRETAGWQILLGGYFGPLMFQFGWFANLILPISMLLIICKATPRKSNLYMWGSMLLLLAINSMFWRDLPEGSYRILPIIHYGAGYFCWMLAVAGGGIFMVAMALRIDLTTSLIVGDDVMEEK